MKAMFKNTDSALIYIADNNLEVYNMYSNTQCSCGQTSAILVYDTGQDVLENLGICEFCGEIDFINEEEV